VKPSNCLLAGAPLTWNMLAAPTRNCASGSNGLLEAHDHAGDFLEHPPPRAVAEVQSKASVGEKPGDRIGRYKLLQQSARAAAA